MKRALRVLLALPLLLAGGVAAAASQPAPEDADYSAHGQYWRLTIAADTIILTSALIEGTETWPRTPSRTAEGVRRWRAVRPYQEVEIEARPGRCKDERRIVFADQVRVVLNDSLVLTGCGGARVPQP